MTSATPVQTLLQNLATSSDPDLHFIALSDLLQTSSKNQTVQLLDAKQSQQVLQLLTSPHADIVMMTVKCIPLMDLNTVIALLDSLKKNDFEEIINMGYQIIIQSKPQFDVKMLHKFIRWGNSDLIIKFCGVYLTELRRISNSELINYVNEISDLEKKYYVMSNIIPALQKEDIAIIAKMLKDLAINNSEIQSRHWYNVLRSILRRNLDFTKEFKDFVKLPENLHEDNILDGCALIDLFEFYIENLLDFFTEKEAEVIFIKLVELIDFSMDEEMDDEDFGFESDLEIEHNYFWRVRFHSLQILSKLILNGSYGQLYDLKAANTSLIKKFLDGESQIIYLATQHFLAITNEKTAKFSNKRYKMDYNLDFVQILKNVKQLFGKDPRNDETLLLLATQIIEHYGLPSELSNLYTNELEFSNRNVSLQINLFSSIVKQHYSVSFIKRVLEKCILHLNTNTFEICQLMALVRKYDLFEQDYDYYIIEPLDQNIVESANAIVHGLLSLPPTVQIYQLLFTFYCDMFDPIILFERSQPEILDILHVACKSSLLLSKKSFIENLNDKISYERLTAVEIQLYVNIIGHISQKMVLSWKLEAFQNISCHIDKFDNYLEFYKFARFTADEKSIVQILDKAIFYTDYILDIISDTSSLELKLREMNSTDMKNVPSKLKLLEFYCEIVAKYNIAKNYLDGAHSLKYDNWADVILLSYYGEKFNVISQEIPNYDNEVLVRLVSKICSQNFDYFKKYYLSTAFKSQFISGYVESAVLSESQAAEIIELLNGLEENLEMNAESAFKCLKIVPLKFNLNQHLTLSIIKNYVKQNLCQEEHISYLCHVALDDLKSMGLYLETLSNIVVQQPDLVTQHLHKVKEYLKNLVVQNPKYLKILDMGMFKVKIDESVTYRKLAYSCIGALIEYNLLKDYDYVQKILLQGLGDIEEARSAALMIIFKIPDSVLRSYKLFSEFYKALCSSIIKPPKLAKLTQDREKTMDFMRTAIRVFQKLKLVYKDGFNLLM
eukprot:NODE_65_length_25825_cov_1.353844.p1 type:complete len:1008 gc:universal NODE_65_length_25825_cov_1.353844:12710-9687(-)